MAYTRSGVRMKWSGGETIRAFEVLREDYRGSTQTKPAQYGRSLYDDGLVAVRATSKRRFTGLIVAYDSPSGAIDGVTRGSIAELNAAHDATDLQVQSFEDDAYWDAEWMGDWDTLIEYDPMRNQALVVAQIEEK